MVIGEILILILAVLLVYAILYGTVRWSIAVAMGAYLKRIKKDNKKINKIKL